ncbi:hypothetical protein Gotri_007271, partial [Gossypium trilobum]|nr:hypothetical protein [Gossypium trilobum]
LKSIDARGLREITWRGPSYTLKEAELYKLQNQASNSPKSRAEYTAKQTPKHSRTLSAVFPASKRSKEPSFSKLTIPTDKVFNFLNHIHRSAMANSENEKILRKMADAFKELAAKVNSQTADMEVAPFSRACSFVSPLFGCLGIAFKFAEMDYVAKVGDLAEASKSIATLKVMLDRDIEGNCVRKAGSHTRNLLRVKRGLDMVRVFAPHHGWAIRKAVAAGMYALPTKAQLMKKLNEDEASARIQMQHYVAASSSVILYIDKLFLSRELGID